MNRAAVFDTAAVVIFYNEPRRIFSGVYFLFCINVFFFPTKTPAAADSPNGLVFEKKIVRRLKK